jgi:hypothetical protein
MKFEFFKLGSKVKSRSVSEVANVFQEHMAKF